MRLDLEGADNVPSIVAVRRWNLRVADLSVDVSEQLAYIGNESGEMDESGDEGGIGGTYRLGSSE